MLAANPRDFDLVAMLLFQAPALLANRVRRIVIDLASLNRWHEFVEQQRQRSDDAGLSLTALAEKHHVVAGEDAVLDFRQYGFIVTDNARHDALLGAQAPEEIVTHLDSDRLYFVAGVLEFAERAQFEQVLIHLISGGCLLIRLFELRPI
jgi:hypothetical protein